MAPPMLAVADGRADDGRLQARERALSAACSRGTGLPADRDEKLIGREAQKARSLGARFSASTSWLAAQMSTSASQMVAMPCSGTAWTLSPGIAGLIEDRRDAPGLGEGEERALHKVALVARAGVARGDDERVELAAFADSYGAARGHRRCLASAGRVAGGAGLDVARIRRRAASRLVRPGLEIVNRIDDTAAELAEGRTASVAAIFFQCARREAEKARGFMCSKEARREFGKSGGHEDNIPCRSHAPRAKPRQVWTRLAGEARRRG